jgi:hypothetical protein
MYTDLKYQDEPLLGLSIHNQKNEEQRGKLDLFLGWEVGGHKERGD